MLSIYAKYLAVTSSSSCASKRQIVLAPSIFFSSNSDVIRVISSGGVTPATVNVVRAGRHAIVMDNPGDSAISSCHFFG